VFKDFIFLSFFLSVLNARGYQSARDLSASKNSEQFISEVRFYAYRRSEIPFVIKSLPF
jgi:hypothetical protein